MGGGANLPLGWGPEIGIRLERNDAGWFASLRPPDGADIRARYRGAGRFVVTSKAGVRDVHQGDPAPIRDEAGGLHDIILRRYRDKPRERVAPVAAETKEGTQLGERIEGKDDQPPPEIDLVG